MNFISYIEENQIWKCPRSGKYKVTCVGGGGTGILYTTSSETSKKYFYQNGEATSFGSYLTAMGSRIVNPKVSCYNDTEFVTYNGYNGYTMIGGYGGYDLFNYGGNPDAVYQNGKYAVYTSGDYTNRINMSFCDRNGGSINEMYAHNTYGAGGYSKVRILKAKAMSSLQFTVKAYYDSRSYEYYTIVSPYHAASTRTSTTKYLSSGVDTITFAGDGKEFVKATMLTSELSSAFLNSLSSINHIANVETSTTTSISASGEKSTYTSNENLTQPYTKFELTESPIASTTKNKVEFYPIKARNNGGMRVDIIELAADEEIACSIGAGGKAINAGLGYAEDLSYLRSGIKSESSEDMSDIIGDGGDGIIVIQYLGA